VEINGIAHLVLTVSRFEVCVPFYESLLTFLGLKEAFKGESMLYYVGGRTGVAIQPCDAEYTDEQFIQTRIGLHHVCFRARSREDVDAVHDFLVANKAAIVHPPQEGPWAPGYYSLLFEDPDGIRLEVNHIPGKRILEEGEKFNPASDYA
jgi:catechol 2,3-dioxygenase-like lactoylglutathione lyase family enzyme